MFVWFLMEAHAAGVDGFPGHVKPYCRNGFTPDCVAQAAFASQGNARLTARFEALLGELAAACDASAGEPDAKVPADPFHAFNTESPGRQACLTIAPLRMGATDAYDGPTEWARQIGGVDRIVPVDFGAGVGALERVCDDLDARPTRARVDACLLLADLAREVGGRATRHGVEHYAARCVVDAARTPCELPPEARVDRGWLTASVQERAAAWEPDDAIDGRLAAVEAAIRGAAVDSSVAGTLFDVRRALPEIPDLARRAALEARVKDLARRAAPPLAERARASRAYVGAVLALQGLAELDGTDATAAVHRALRAEAAAFHAGLARAHAAAKRPAAAALHVAYAKQLDPLLADLPATSREQLRPPSTLAPRFAGTPCAWAAPAAKSAPDALLVTLTVTRCEASEKIEPTTHTERVRVEVPRKVKERVVISEPTRVCTDGGLNCTTTGQLVVEEREKIVYDEKFETVTREFVRRTLTVGITATAQVERDGAKVSVPFTSATPPAVEAYEVERPRAWTGTFDAPQALVRDELTSLLDPGGPVAVALAREHARLLLRRAEAATNPEDTEELLARALLLSAADVPEAHRWLAERYGDTGLVSRLTFPGG